MLSALTLCLLSSAALPTDAELTAFGRAIAADLSGGKDGVTPRIDFEAMVDRVLSGVEPPAGFRDGFVKGLAQGSQQSWTALATGATGHSSITFKRVTKTDGLPAVELRVLFDAGSFDFVEFLVARRPDGELAIVDIFGIADGALRTESMRMLAIPAMKNLQLSQLERLLGKESKVARHLDDLLKMNQAMNAADYAKVVTVWASLPKEVGEHRLFFKPYIAALSQVKSPDYEASMARFVELYPKDAAAQVMGIDFFFLRGLWAQCLKSITAVEARAGRDAWFDVLRGTVALKQQNVAGAKKSLEAAMTLEPTLKLPWLTRIDLALSEKKWAEVTRYMAGAEKHLGVAFDVSAKGFEGYAASPEGRAWLAAHPRVAAP